MVPVLFRIGPITAYSFRAMMAIAFLLAGHILSIEIARTGKDPDLGGFASGTVLINPSGWPWLGTADCVAPALAPGQAIGRIGCQLSTACFCLAPSASFTRA